jgi:hypothetical protein
MLAAGIDCPVVRSCGHHQHAFERTELDCAGRCATQRQRWHDDSATAIVDGNAAGGFGWHDHAAAEPDAAGTLGDTRGIAAFTGNGGGRARAGVLS